MFNATFGTVFTIATTILLIVFAGPIVLMALRTGRWLGQGVVYDKVTTPVRFRLALWSFLVMTALLVFMSIFTSYWLIVIAAG